MENEWKRIGNTLTENQCRELEKLSQIGGDNDSYDSIDSATNTLIKMMKEYKEQHGELNSEIIDKLNKL